MTFIFAWLLTSLSLEWFASAGLRGGDVELMEVGVPDIIVMMSSPSGGDVASTLPNAVNELTQPVKNHTITHRQSL